MVSLEETPITKQLSYKKKKRHTTKYLLYLLKKTCNKKSGKKTMHIKSSNGQYLIT